MTSEDKTGPPAIRTLLNEAEMEAERTMGWVRVVLALALAVSLLGSGGIASVAGNAEVWSRLGLGLLPWRHSSRSAPPSCYFPTISARGRC